MIAILVSTITFRNMLTYAMLLCVMAGVRSCQSKHHDKRWDNAIIDAAISNNAVYQQLDQEREVSSVLDIQDTSAKRTSGVAYFTKGHVNLTDSSSARLNNCRAYFFNRKILTIDIGIGDGFGGWGFFINYKNGMFYTEPYYSTDVDDPADPEPVFNVLYQKLSLNKTTYEPGDSLYGKIEFKSTEIDQDGKEISHSGNGYFRTVIEER